MKKWSIGNLWKKYKYVGQNWRWRLKKTQLSKKLQKEICQLTTRYGRMNWA